ncbi:MAG: DNA polymerase III subunit delta' [Desulfovibrio sp.]|jgi:DNA polymerase-3 subunit delta'|nr:DNA polymerase III subunit delta' [Desulfovibrio sp.]
MKKSAAPKRKRDAGKIRDAGHDASGTTGVAASDDILPGKEEIAAAQTAIRVFMKAPEQGRMRLFLERLRPAPPQVLLLEGGTTDDRLAAAHYWSLLLNCPAAISPPEGAGVGVPCLDCSECLRMLMHMHRDCFFFDGRAGSIKIDDVRAMRAVLGEPAREARCRTVIFCEAQSLVEAAANALLKSLEEPRPGTSFVILAPQREALLPTLVSRSLVLTLPWPHAADPGSQAHLAPWEDALCSFLRGGCGFFERSGSRGAVNPALAHDLINVCRRALVRRLFSMQSGIAPAEGLDVLLARLPLQRLRILDEALAECQDSLMYKVDAALVLEWLATRLYLLLPGATTDSRPTP